MSQRIRVLQELGGEFERLVTGSADAAAGARGVPPTRPRRRRWLRSGIGAVPVLAAVLVPLVVVGAALVLLGRGERGAPSSPPPGQSIVVGQRVTARSVEVAGAAGTLQLRAVDVPRSPTRALFATLMRPVAREPDDVCFGVYTTGENADGNVACSVRGPGRLPSVAGEIARPGAGPLTVPTYLVGQVPQGATRVELVAPNGSHELQLSVARTFLVVFAHSTRGRVELRVSWPNGRELTSAFTLPLSPAQMSAFSDRYHRPGAVFNDQIGERIIGTSYVQIVRRFGRPLATLSSRNGERCVYYDVVGSATGWSFCFKHGILIAAGGEQQAPPGVK